MGETASLSGPSESVKRSAKKFTATVYIISSCVKVLTVCKMSLIHPVIKTDD